MVAGCKLLETFPASNLMRMVAGLIHVDCQSGKTLILQRCGHFSDVYGITILVGYVIAHFG